MRKCVEIYTMNNNKDEPSLERKFLIFELNYIIFKGDYL